MLADGVKWLFRSSMLEVALALGLGYAFFTFANAVATEVFDVVGRVSGSRQIGFATVYAGGIYSLSFHVGNTEVYYGFIVSATLTLILVALTALAVRRARTRELGACPYCLSPVPWDASVCRFCTLEFDPPSAPPLSTK
jgi:large conductance mechanosensitive channel